MSGKIQYLLIFLIFFSCNRSVKLKNTPQVEVVATVKDMRKLDGCTYLLITDEGKKLLPVNLDRIPFALKDGQKIAFTYNKKQNVDGICMAEDMIVEIIAIRLLEDQTKPGKKECTDMNDPVKTEWGRSLMMKEKVYRMWKFNYQDGYAYYFLSPDGNLLFDCQGNKMCSDLPQQNKCIDNISELNNGQVVWTLNQ
jgi:hypothetical protein